MCLIVFAWRPGQRLPLLVAGNRDEFHARPTAALAQWPGRGGVYAGRDLEAGGSWMGIGPGGRFAAVTNIRAPGMAQGTRSRGELVAAYLQGDASLAAYAQATWQQAGEYRGFNLLLGDSKHLCYLSSQQPPVNLPTGVYGLSNAALGTPWPKVARAQAVLAECLAGASDTELFGLLRNEDAPEDAALPDTGVGLEAERQLSTAFIRSAQYGTRASTLLYVQANGERRMVERSFAPMGVAMGTVELRVSSAPEG